MDCTFHGYESGVLLYKKNINGAVLEGEASALWNKTEFYTYLNGLKVGIYTEDESSNATMSKGNSSKTGKFFGGGPETHNYYCSYDGQGNVSQVSNMAGDMPYNLYAYDSYGNQTGNDYSNDSFSSYKGYDKGPFGYKTGVRQYDPETGRFLSPDAFKGYITDPASQHPYMYCHGNPIGYSDPSGYDAVYILYGHGRRRWSKNEIENLRDNGKNTVTESNLSVADLRIALKNADYLIIVAHGMGDKQTHNLNYINEFRDHQNNLIWSDKFTRLIATTSSIKTKLLFADFCYSGKLTQYGKNNMKSLKMQYVGYSNKTSDSHRGLYIIKSIINGASLGDALMRNPAGTGSVRYLMYP